MSFPSVFEWGFPSAMYLLLFYILVRGSIQLYRVKTSQEVEKRSFVPLGALGLIVGLIAFVEGIRAAFDAIAEAGDISPGLGAEGISSAYSYPTLGLVILAVSYAFKYLTQ